MLAATHLRSRPRWRQGRAAALWRRRLLRPIRSARHAFLGIASLWAATAWAAGSQRPATKQSATLEGNKAVDDKNVPVTHVIVLGDSISHGTGASRPGLSYASLLMRNDDARYPEDAGLDLQHLFGPQAKLINLAFEGDTTYDVLAKQLPKLMALLEADARQQGPVQKDGPLFKGRAIVVLTAGGNDFQSGIRPNPNFTGSTLDRSLINLSSIFEAVSDKRLFSEGANVYFGSIYDVTDGEDQLHACKQGMAFAGMSDALEVWSRSYAQLAHEQGAKLVDMLHLFRGHGFNYDNPDNPFFDPSDTTLWVYDHDCIHPNNLGHHMLRRAFFERIERDWTPQASLTDN